MKQVYHLGTCSTCKRILGEVSWPNDISFIDIKKESITSEVLELLKEQYGTFESVFSKKARRYKDVQGSITCDEDYKALILSDYTFLRRPVIIYDEFYSVGNNRNAVAQVQERFKAF